MKGIIMAIAIAAGTALGGAASGQTQEEVNEIIRRAQRIGINELYQCVINPRITKKQYVAIVTSFVKTHRMQLMRAKVSTTQINEAICRYMNNMK